LDRPPRCRFDEKIAYQFYENLSLRPMDVGVHLSAHGSTTTLPRHLRLRSSHCWRVKWACREHYRAPSLRGIGIGGLIFSLASYTRDPWVLVRFGLRWREDARPCDSTLLVRRSRWVAAARRSIWILESRVLNGISGSPSSFRCSDWALALARSFAPCAPDFMNGPNTFSVDGL